MDLPAGVSLVYIVGHDAWHYRRCERPSLTVGARRDGGGWVWEFQVVEHRLGWQGDPAIRVELFDDAFGAFAQAPEVFAALAAEHPRTLADVRMLLEQLGAVDATQRTRPGVA